MQRKLLHDYINDKTHKEDLEKIARIAKKQALLDIGTVKLLIRDKK